jgi:hypothetical protein
MKKICNSVIYSIILLGLFLGCNCAKNEHLSPKRVDSSLKPTSDDGTWFMLKKDEIVGNQHTRHEEIYKKYVAGYNLEFMKAIDKIQATAPDGGGYFIGLKSDPPESPIGYDLCFLGKPLLKAPRTTSYCSGSSYTAFVEGLNLIYQNSDKKIDSLHYEAIRMQEPDGSRREDGVKMWGNWNADGFGNYFALVCYSKTGKQIQPVNARPGDFLNISWKSGVGHSVVFLGWYIDEKGVKNVVYWSSQKSCNGLGDQVVPIDKIKEVLIVRVTNPENIFTFDVKNIVTNGTGSQINL